MESLSDSFEAVTTAEKKARHTSNKRGKLFLDRRTPPDRGIDEFIQIRLGVVGEQVGSLGSIHH